MKKSRPSWFLMFSTGGGSFDTKGPLQDGMLEIVQDLVDNEWVEDDQIRTTMRGRYLVEYQFGKDFIGRLSMRFCFIQDRKRYVVMPEEDERILARLRNEAFCEHSWIRVIPGRRAKKKMEHECSECGKRRWFAAN